MKKISYRNNNQYGLMVSKSSSLDAPIGGRGLLFNSFEYLLIELILMESHACVFLLSRQHLLFKTFLVCFHGGIFHFFLLFFNAMESLHIKMNNLSLLLLSNLAQNLPLLLLLYLEIQELFGCNLFCLQILFLSIIGQLVRYQTLFLHLIN